MPQVRMVTPDGAAIRSRRMELGLPPEEVATPIHRHPQTIRRLENGRMKSASEMLLAQVARVLNCAPGELAARQPEVAA